MPKPLRRLPDASFYLMMAAAPPFEKIIKSAIVLESEIEEIFNRAFHDPSHLHKMGMRYEQKVELVLALGLQERYGSPLRALAKIRNEFAHNLDAKFTADQSSNFFSSFDKSDRKVIRENSARFNKGDPEGFDNLDPSDKFVICVVTLRAAIKTAQLQTTQLLSG